MKHLQMKMSDESEFENCRQLKVQKQVHLTKKGFVSPSMDGAAQSL